MTYCLSTYTKTKGWHLTVPSPTSRMLLCPPPREINYIRKDKKPTRTREETKGIALALMMLLLCPNTLFAQNNDNSRSYVGIQGGIPMAMSTTSSFGGDKTRCGWSAGIFVGNQFTDVFGI